MTGRIYIIKNRVNNLVYIGQTIHTLEQRFYMHKLCVKPGVKTKLYKAMYEIGVENFYIELLVELETTPQELTLLETDYINKYDSIVHGYNSVIPVVNSSSNKREFLNENIEKIICDYKSGLSYSHMCRKYNISKVYISRICSKFKEERELEGTEITNRRKPVIAYNKDTFEPLYYFDSIMDAYNYLCNINKKVTKYGAYYYIEQSCGIGSIAYGFRWQFLSDIVYDNKIFRTSFDKIAYINGANAVKKNGKTYYTCDNALTNIKALEINKTKCIDCGRVVRSGTTRCNECYKVYTANINKNELETQYKCIICNRYKALKPEGMCISCSNVVAKGKTPKPSKEELEDLLNRGISKKSIAKMYGRTDSTIHYWINSYGLR